MFLDLAVMVVEVKIEMKNENRWRPTNEHGIQSSHNKTQQHWPLGHLLGTYAIRDVLQIVTIYFILHHIDY